MSGSDLNPTSLREAVKALTLVNVTGTAGDILVHAMLGYAVLQALLLTRLGLWISRRFVASLIGANGTPTAAATSATCARSNPESCTVAIPRLAGGSPFAPARSSRPRARPCRSPW